MDETTLMKRILIATSAVGARLFRNNVGVFQTARGTKVRTGLCTGSADLIGWTSVLITPGMVGQHVAVFTAVEIKTKDGRLTQAQKNFLEVVDEAGGLAGVARSEEDAIEIISTL